MSIDLSLRYPHDALDRLARWCLTLFFLVMPISLAGANLTMGAILILWLLAGRFGLRWRAVRSLAVTPAVLGLAALILLGCLYSTGAGADMVQHLLKYSKLLLLLMAASLLVDEGTRERCWTAFTAAMVLTLALSFANVWWDQPWSKTHNVGWGQDHSVFKDYITQGSMMALLMLRALHQGLSARGWRRTLWWLVAGLAFVCNTQLSWGRTGYLATGMALLAFTFSQVPGRAKLLALAGMLAALASAAWVSPQIQLRAQLAIHELGDYKTDTFSSIGQRMYFWTKSLQLWSERPWWGWGTGGYHGQFCRVATSEQWCLAGSFHPHNQFLFFAVEYGLLGLSMYAFLLAMAVWGGMRCQRADRSLVWGFVGILCVGSMTHSGLWLSSESFFYVFALGLAATMGCRAAAPQAAAIPCGGTA